MIIEIARIDDAPVMPGTVNHGSFFFELRSYLHQMMLHLLETINASDARRPRKRAASAPRERFSDACINVL